jgi:hypothetical protein
MNDHPGTPKFSLPTPGISNTEVIVERENYLNASFIQML